MVKHNHSASRKSRRTAAARINRPRSGGGGFALAAEAVVVLLAFSSDVPFLWTILCHAGVVAVTGIILFRRPVRRRR